MEVRSRRDVLRIAVAGGTAASLPGAIWLFSEPISPIELFTQVVLNTANLMTTTEHSEEANVLACVWEKVLLDEQWNNVLDCVGWAQLQMTVDLHRGAYDPCAIPPYAAHDGRTSE
jgi:hypothetical protein